jgi:hypothetical protein
MNGNRIAGMFAQGSKALYAATGDFRFAKYRHRSNHVQLNELVEIHHLCSKFTIFA